MFCFLVKEGFALMPVHLLEKDQVNARALIPSEIYTHWAYTCNYGLGSNFLR